jgi:hypothetical protein
MRGLLLARRVSPTETNPMRLDVGVCALSAGMLLLSAEVQAQDVPDGCRDTGSSKNARSYQQGKSVGKSLVQVAWKQLKTCSRMRNVADLVTVGLKAIRPTSNGRPAVCLYTGAVDGVFQGLDAIFATCNDQCCLEGEVIGKMSATLYCDLSILLGGLGEPEHFVRGPVDTCGAAFQTCCDATYTVTSQRYSAKTADGKTVSCQPYTRGAYQSVWTETRDLECGYELVLPEDVED